jgi:DNA-3-methyladenine glycosylase
LAYKKLPRSFYTRNDVVAIARDLLGKVLCTSLENCFTSGIIVETEAYAGAIDRASHAHGERRTERTEIMYAKGGTAYVYLCYGIHHLFNVVTNEKNIPHAILIRAVEPVDGIEYMLFRRKKKKLDFTLTRGPGSVSQALGIFTKNTGEDLLGKNIWIEDRKIYFPKNKIIAAPRIGVDYAGDDAKLPYRFYVKDSKWVSR